MPVSGSFNKRGILYLYMKVLMDSIVVSELISANNFNEFSYIFSVPGFGLEYFDIYIK